MGTITGQEVADRAWTKAGEATGGAATRWTPDEALWWLNDGQRAAVKLFPRAYALRATPTPVAGTRQTLVGLSLTGGQMVLDVMANYNLGGTVRGAAIRRCAREWLDEMLPDWHSKTATEADNWVPDETDPASFYLFPAPAGKVEVLYSALPASLADLSDPITLDDKWSNALQYFLLFSFFSKDATFVKSLQLGTSAYALFQNEMGVDPQTIEANARAISNKAKGA